eukprot:COSAG01_NODE_40067_length_468_cov_0.829268_1_plen_45_part_10
MTSDITELSSRWNPSGGAKACCDGLRLRLGLRLKAGGWGALQVIP